MLDYVMELLPSPSIRTPSSVRIPDTDAEVQIKPNEKEPFRGPRIQDCYRPFVGRLCFIRAYSGVLEEFLRI